MGKRFGVTFDFEFEPRYNAVPSQSLPVVASEPNAVVADLYPRMAVVLAPEKERTWLHGSVDEADVLLDPYDGPMRTYCISTAVNSPSNDSPAIIEEVEWQESRAAGNCLTPIAGCLACFTERTRGGSSPR